jgi:hypothetical protein
MNMMARAYRALAAASAIFLFVAPLALAKVVGPAIGLEDLALKVDQVCKATVVTDRAITDDWFEPIGGYEVRDEVQPGTENLRQSYALVA